ncbi:fluoride efflux transporter CrcB [Williamsia deligens]|uniref:Fluoride-specific ion channel FluC n=1 Tax=Williamsia deligens TaxID=321325 RepID=A0ABW3G623_9NOCA|nr:fluoride efflux transporter CrcB [Williamsia deligens]MCP2193305.1 CrcB protein [Williamsia deligens]
MIVALVFLAGALGSVTRFVVDSEVKARLAPRFPWATVGINISGSFVLGVLAGAVLFHAASPDWQTVLGTGFCGGYTTFSTASVETVRLAQARRHAAALINLLGTLGLSVGACALGLVLASAA